MSERIQRKIQAKPWTSPLPPSNAGRKREPCHVVVFGGSDYGSGSLEVRTAREIGAGIASNGDILVVGDPMGDLTRACMAGALQRGGRVVVVAPKSFSLSLDSNFPSAEFPNASSAVKLDTVEDVADTEPKLLEVGDAFVFIPGGSYVERQMSLVTAACQHQPHKPIVGVDLNGFYSERLEEWRQSVVDNRKHPLELELFMRAQSPSDALAILGRALSHPFIERFDTMLRWAAKWPGEWEARTQREKWEAAPEEERAKLIDAVLQARTPVKDGTSAIIVRRQHWDQLVEHPLWKAGNYHGALVATNPSVLVAERRGSHEAGKWAYPGGSVNSGEQKFAAATAREVLEETDVPLDPSALLPCGVTREFFHFQLPASGKLRNCRTIFFVAVQPLGKRSWRSLWRLVPQEPRVMEPSKVGPDGWIWMRYKDLMALSVPLWMEHLWKDGGPCEVGGQQPDERQSVPTSFTRPLTLHELS